MLTLTLLRLQINLGLLASLFINNIKIQKDAQKKDADTDTKDEPEHTKDSEGGLKVAIGTVYNSFPDHSAWLS